jgi:hypothetical protein
MTHRLSKILILSFILIFTKNSYSQFYYYNDKYYDKDLIWEVGASYGIMNSVTDVGKKSVSSPFLPSWVQWKNSHGNGSFYIGVNYKDIVGGRLEFTMGKISGADSLGKHTLRNLSFRSNISEIALIGEVYPLNFKYNENGISKFSPYLMAGIGWFSFNPQSYYQGRWYDLQPLRTEGQGFKEVIPNKEPYKLSQANVPVGVGLKYEISNLFTARFEILYRFLFTDYLDDAAGGYIDPNLFDTYFNSQKAAVAKALFDRRINGGDGSNRGTEKSKDHYFNINFKLGITLGRQRIH